MIDFMLIIVDLLQFSAVFLLIYSIFRFTPPSQPPMNRRIAQALGQGHRNTVFENPILAPAMSAGLEVGRRLPFVNLRERIRKDLDASGNPSGYTVDEYLALCLAASVALGIFSALTSLLVINSLSFTAMLFLGAIGFFVPLWAVRGQAVKRVIRISKRLPYTLDLVALMMGAGSTFSEAIEAVIRDDPEEDLNQELKIVQAEIEFGSTRALALTNMAQRIGHDSLYSVVGAINQSDQMGSPLSSILKEQAITIRQHRSVMAEKAAAAASLKILIPSMLILIAVVIVILAPMVITGLSGNMM